MKKIKGKSKKYLRCQSCQKNAAGVYGVASDGRPRYRCNSCGDTWTNGK